MGSFLVLSELLFLTLFHNRDGHHVENIITVVSMPHHRGFYSSDLGIYDCYRMEQEATTLALKKRIIRASLRYLYRFEKPVEKIFEPVMKVCESLLQRFSGGGLSIKCRLDSTEDHSSKLALETHDGHVIESVIIRNRKEHKTTLCISSQVGCTEKCQFCATATLGFKRNLKPAEILDQLRLAQEIVVSEGRRITHVVFMGMGEPLRNTNAVMDAIEVMLSPRGFQLSPNSVSVSTLGIPSEMLRLTRRWPEVQLVLSLHAAKEDLRSDMMPINAKHSVSELKKTMLEIESYRPGTIMVSYLMFRGLNDSLECAQDLADFLREHRVVINLIPFNETDLVDSRFIRNERQKTYDFRNFLIKQGFFVTVRESFGKDIDAACGQLAVRI